MLATPSLDPDGRSLAHPVLISDDWRRSELQDRDGARAVEVAIVDPAQASGSTLSGVAAATKSSLPPPQQSVPEHGQALEVPWYRVVVEVALHDQLEPSARLGHGIMHVHAKLLLEFSKLGSHALADRRASHG